MAKRKRNKQADLNKPLLIADADLCITFDETGIEEIYAKSQPNIKILLINKKDKVYETVRIDKEKCFTDLTYILNKIINND